MTKVAKILYTNDLAVRRMTARRMMMEAKTMEVVPVQEPQLPAPLPTQAVIQHVAAIQDIMRKVMKDGEHYGKIPGCGDKPTLLKPGAEKLAMTFRLCPRIYEEVILRSTS